MIVDTIRVAVSWTKSCFKNAWEIVKFRNMIYQVKSIFRPYFPLATDFANDRVSVVSLYGQRDGIAVPFPRWS